MKTTIKIIIIAAMLLLSLFIFLGGLGKTEKSTGHPCEYWKDVELGEAPIKCLEYLQNNK